MSPLSSTSTLYKRINKPSIDDEIQSADEPYVISNNNSSIVSKNADGSSDNNADNGSKQHIEVCVRLRPLIVQNLSSSSFFGKSSPSNNDSRTSHLRKPSTSSSIPTSRLATPGIRGGSARKPSVPRSSSSAQQQQQTATPVDSEGICAWHVITDDTVVQSPDTDIVQGRTCQYTLDRVYGHNTSTEELYCRSVRELVHAAMDGYHTSVLAYGQTGTGKTHTMTGTAAQPGLIPLCIQECFDWLRYQNKNREYLLRVSYLEVYNENIRDLLATNPATAPPVRLFDDSAGHQVVTGLREEVVTSPEQVFAFLAQGEARRQVGATNMNAHSSRSHVMVRLWIESSEINNNNSSPHDYSPKNKNSKKVGVRVSSLSLVDLAGSESVRLSGGHNERQQEGHYINKSLMALGKVVYALSENNKTINGIEIMAGKKRHVPFRDSKLTRLLQPSLAGNAQVVLLCCVSPQVSHIEESHNTLKFAVRAKKIPQKAVLQEGLSDEKTLLQSYRDEIEALKRQLKDMQEQQENISENRKVLDINDNNNNVETTGSPASTESTCSSTNSVYSSAQVNKADADDTSRILEDQNEAVRELVEAIQTMEKLILKSNVDNAISPVLMDGSTPLRRKLSEEEELDLIVGSIEENSCCDEDEEGLLRLASRGGIQTPMASSLNTNNINKGSYPRDGNTNFRISPQIPLHHNFQFSNNKEMTRELQRIQGLLGSVLKQANLMRTTHASNNNNSFTDPEEGGGNDSVVSQGDTTMNSTIQTTLPSYCGRHRGSGGRYEDYGDEEEQQEVVKTLRMQLEEHKVSSYLRKADASFLQRQLEEKDMLLAEVSALLEAVEDRQSQLEAENASLRNELDKLKASNRLRL